MTDEIFSEVPAAEPPPSGRRLPWPLRIGVGIENGVIVFALAMMVLLPIWDSVTRVLHNFATWFVAHHPSNISEAILDLVPHLTITGSSEFVRYGTLIVGVIGAAIAARENRLLSLATSTALPKGWPRTVAHIVSAGVGGAVGIFLCVASIQWFRDTRAGSSEIAYGIQAWMMQLSLVVGFILITLGVLYHGAPQWKLKWIAPLIAVAIALFYAYAPIEPIRFQTISLVVLLVAALLGAPIFVILGGSTLILLWAAEWPVSSIPLDHYSLTTNEALPTIPLFTLAGYFLAEGGASKRLVRVFTELFGSIRGGPAIVTALLCAFFTSFTGASGVTILALGGVLMPILLAAGYRERAALGLLTGAGSLGMLFPPCLPLILYAIISKVRIEDIFLGAILPGLLLVVMTAILGIWMGPRTSVSEERKRFDFDEARRAMWAAKWELLIPVVAIVTLFAGIATPVEASAITAFYAFLTQTLFQRDLSLRKNVPHVLVECGLVIGGVLLILGLAQGFTNYLITAEVPTRAIAWLTASVESPYVFLLILNLFLVVVGGLMDIYPAIVVVAPLIVPIGQAFNIDPIHLGVVFLANLEMGFLMPPLGINLLLSSYRFKKPIPEVYRAILPVLAVQFVGVLLITYVPFLTTWLPRLVSGNPP